MKDIIAFCCTARSRKELAQFLGLGSVSYAITHYVQPLVDAGELLLTIPNKPKSTKQKYIARNR